MLSTAIELVRRDAASDAFLAWNPDLSERRALPNDVTGSRLPINTSTLPWQRSSIIHSALEPIHPETVITDKQYGTSTEEISIARVRFKLAPWAESGRSCV
jgi:hypothetical protein